jgi:hypothetical protein
MTYIQSIKVNLLDFLNHVFKPICFEASKTRSIRNIRDRGRKVAGYSQK